MIIFLFQKYIFWIYVFNLNYKDELNILINQKKYKVIFSSGFSLILLAYKKYFFY